VTSRTTADFWACFNSLPLDVQQLARAKYRLWRVDAFNSALHFKPLVRNVWSVRINQSYRALGKRQGNLIVRFWIGTHSEYDQLLKRLA
jgi:hypothetical protein